MIRLRGAKQRPWLELRRCETQRRYLSHQIRRLRELHDGPLEVIRDIVPSDGFYDVHRARIFGEGLYHVYELLYPRDEFRIAPEVLTIVGNQGLVSLWCDRGRWFRQRPAFVLPFQPEDNARLEAWACSWGLDAKLIEPHNTISSYLRIEKHGVEWFRRKMRPLLHPTMRPTLALPKLLK